MAEMIPFSPAPMTLEDARAELRAMADAMQTMAAMLRATNENMEALRRQVTLLEKVTPAQATQLNRAIRSRAQALCGDYRLPEAGERAVAAEIRKALRLQFGARTVKDLPRCEHETAMQLVGMWDDYKVMTGMRRKLK